MWPSPHSAWRSQAGPPPGHLGQPLHHLAWTSTTNATPTMFFPGQHVPTLPPRDLPQPSPKVHQYHQHPDPASTHSMSFGHPQVEPPTLVLQQATQMFSDVLRQFTSRPTWFSPFCTRTITYVSTYTESLPYGTTFGTFAGIFTTSSTDHTNSISNPDPIQKTPPAKRTPLKMTTTKMKADIHKILDSRPSQFTDTLRANLPCSTCIPSPPAAVPQLCYSTTTSFATPKSHHHTDSEIDKNTSTTTQKPSSTSPNFTSLRLPQSQSFRRTHIHSHRRQDHHRADTLDALTPVYGHTTTAANRLRPIPNIVALPATIVSIHLVVLDHAVLLLHATVYRLDLRGRSRRHQPVTIKPKQPSQHSTSNRPPPRDGAADPDTSHCHSNQPSHSRIPYPFGSLAGLCRMTGTSGGHR